MPEYDREPRHTLAADEAHLDGLATIGNDRGKAALGEVDRLDGPLAPLQHLAQRQVGMLDAGLDQPLLSAR